MIKQKTERGVSAVGSAQHWQCWGQGFESPTLHQTDAQSAFQPFQKNSDPHPTGAGRCSFLFLLRKKSLQSVPAVFAAAGSRVISPTRMPGKRPSHRGKSPKNARRIANLPNFRSRNRIDSTTLSLASRAISTSAGIRMKMLKLPLETKNPDRYCGPGSGAGNQSRTDDLVITNDVLYQLSHASIPTFLSTSLLYQTFFRLSRGFVKKISQIRAFCGESGKKSRVRCLPFASEE